MFTGALPKAKAVTAPETLDRAVQLMPSLLWKNCGGGGNPLAPGSSSVAASNVPFPEASPVMALFSRPVVECSFQVVPSMLVSTTGPAADFPYRVAMNQVPDP